MDEAVIDISSLEGSEQQGSEQQETPVEAQPLTEGGQEPQVSEPGAEQNSEVLSGKAIRDAVRAAAEQFPEQAKLFKQLADTHFRVETAYKVAFPTPQEATSAKQLIEAAGGIEGIAQATQRIQSYDQQDAALKEGNPEVLDAMFKDFPEGAAALAPHYLEKLAASNPQAYADAIGPHALQMLAQAGVGEHLKSILAESDPNRAAALVKQLSDWFNGQTANAAQARQGRTAQNPGEDKIKQRETALNQREEKIFQETAGSKARDAIAAPFNAVVDQYAKSYKLNDAQKDHFSTTLESKVKAEMIADKTYMQQLNLRLANKSRTHETVASYISGEFTRRCKEQAFAVAKTIYGSPKGGAAAAQSGTGQVKAGQPKTAPGGGPLVVSSKPTDEQYDWNKPDPETAQLYHIRGFGYLKSGHFVKWR